MAHRRCPAAVLAVLIVAGIAETQEPGAETAPIRPEGPPDIMPRETGWLVRLPFSADLTEGTVVTVVASASVYQFKASDHAIVKERPEWLRSPPSWVEVRGGRGVAEVKIHRLGLVVAEYSVSPFAQKGVKVEKEMRPVTREWRLGTVKERLARLKEDYGKPREVVERFIEALRELEQAWRKAGGFEEPAGRALGRLNRLRAACRQEKRGACAAVFGHLDHLAGRAAQKAGRLASGIRDPVGSTSDGRIAEIQEWEMGADLYAMSILLSETLLTLLDETEGVVDAALSGGDPDGEGVASIRDLLCTAERDLGKKRDIRGAVTLIEGALRTIEGCAGAAPEEEAGLRSRLQSFHEDAAGCRKDLTTILPFPGR